MPYLTKEKVTDIFTTFGGTATNTGSIEGQIAFADRAHQWDLPAPAAK